LKTTGSLYSLIKLDKSLFQQAADVCETVPTDEKRREVGICP
jgi:hypothetical protein